MPVATPPLLGLLLACLAPFSVSAAPAGNAIAVPLWSVSAVHVDADGSASAAAVIGGRHAWQRARSGQDLALGLTPAALWLRLEWPASLARVAAPRLVIDNPVLDDIAVWRPSQGVAALARGGERTPYAARPLRHRLHVFPLPGVTPGELIYVRAGGASPLRVAGRLTGATALAEAEAHHALHVGLFYGLMLALFLYNLALAIASPQPGMPWYLAWLASATAIRAVMDGLPAALLPALDWPALADHGGVTIGFCTLFTGTAFCRRFLDTARHAPVLDRLLRLHLGLLAAAALAALGAPPRAGQYAVYAGVALTLGVLAVTFTTLLARGLRRARFLALTFVPLASGVALWGARLAGWSPWPTLAPYAMHIGMGLEAVLLSFAMADRINTLRGDKVRAERGLLAAQQRFSSALLRTQERERRQLAAELHDGVGQNALAVKARLERWAGRGTDETALRDGAALMADVVAGVRDVARRLHPSVLTRLGLQRALEQLLQPLGEDGVAVDSSALDLAAADALAPETALMIYRIVQEAVANVVRHAGASHVSLAGRCGTRGLELVLEDDGRGIAPDAAGGLGLVTMRERARTIGATLEVGPRAPRGTRVALRLEATRYGEPRDENPAG